MKKILFVITAVVLMAGSVIGLAGCSTKYQVKISPNIEHGTITASETMAYAGDLITVTVTPDEGYKLDDTSLKANDMLIALYSFTMPKTTVTITATFVPITTISYDISQSIFEKTEALLDNYVGKPNTQGGAREVVEVPDSEVYTVLLNVTEAENYVVTMFDGQVSNQTMVIALGNNRFIEKPIYKKMGTTFYFLIPVLHSFSQNGLVELSVADKDFSLKIENTVATLEVGLAEQNENDLTILPQNIISALSLSDAVIEIMFENEGVALEGAYITNSAITIVFDDQSQIIVLQSGTVVDGVFTLSLLDEFLPEGKQVASYSILTHVLQGGMARYGVEFHPVVE